jgi:hypothetical protein
MKEEDKLKNEISQLKEQHSSLLTIIEEGQMAER